MNDQPAPTPAVEVRLPVDATEPPFAYDHGDGTLAVDIALTGGGWLALHLDPEHARAWACDLDSAVITAHRETVPDPHGLDDWILAELADPNAYRPAATLHLTGSDGEPARMAFTIALTIRGLSLDDGTLRAALVTSLTTDFNVEHVAVSNGTPAT